MAAQVDPSQWNAYYGYGQGYDAYAYGAAQDPSLYAYGAYAGYPQYAQQVNILTSCSDSYHQWFPFGLQYRLVALVGLFYCSPPLKLFLNSKCI